MIKIPDSEPALADYLKKKAFFEALYGGEDQAAPADIQARHVEAMREARQKYQALPPKNITKLTAWLEQRDLNWITAQSSAAAVAAAAVDPCLHCAINASCYDPAVNSWHPAKCPALKEYKPENIFLDEKCFNLSALILGDSRGRFLLMGILRRFYPEWKGLHR